MDFGGLISIDGLVSSSSLHGGDVFSSSPASTDSDIDNISGFFGSGFLKQGRTAGVEKHDWRCIEMAKTEVPHLLPDRQQLPRFSSSKLDAFLLTSDSRLPTSSYIGNTGFNFGRLDANSNESSVGARGIFTPSQWMELENQALIYSYIDANAEIPANLQISMRRSFYPFGFSAFSTGSFRPSALERGSFHVGLSGNADPEPGRCRRTDGKKWRCSRDAVADQKYCERHLNRGRHRSRKPVEGHSGQATRMMHVITTSQAASASFSSRSCNSLAMAQQQMNNLQTSTTSSATTQLNSMIVSKEKTSTCSKDTEELCKLTLLNSKATDTSFPDPKQNQVDKLSSSIDTGFISSCSLSLPPSSSHLENNRNVPCFELSDQQFQPHALQHFTWPEREDTRSDNYELSSTPVPTALDFLSRSSSPSGTSQRLASGIPFIWDSPAGGPLAEALKNTGKALDHGKKSSLDLMMDNWEMSPWTGSSSTTSSPKQKPSHSTSSRLSHDFPVNPTASPYCSPLTK